MKLICIGKNYLKHIEELHSERPSDPVVFMKPDSAILPNDQPFVIPEFSDNIHHEVEVLVKIKKHGKYIDKKYVPKYYDEIGLGIDFTARDLQNNLKDKGLPWEKCKAFDGSAVVGKWIDKSKFGDLNDLGFTLIKNNEVVQLGNTSNMLWKIDEIIEYVSKYFTLKKGDIIFTGTPEGVGKVFAGDTLKGLIEDTEMFSIKVK